MESSFKSCQSRVIEWVLLIERHQLRVIDWKLLIECLWLRVVYQELSESFLRVVDQCWLRVIKSQVTCWWWLVTVTNFTIKIIVTFMHYSLLSIFLIASFGIFNKKLFFLFFYTFEWFSEFCDRHLRGGYWKIFSGGQM